ncbi:MAG TPA: hypothetical protein VGP10_11755, partial [Marisediminicola sp.]|nr:hypothetical protein [Marisediminicola sp.]
MAITPRSVSVGVFLSVLAVSLLAGCTSADPAPVATPEPVASEPAPQEPAVDAPEKPDDTLFTVSATVRATDGTSMSISLVGHSPLESTDPAAADLVDDFVEECVGQGGLSVSDVNTPVSTQSLAQFGSTLVQLEYSSTPEGHTFFAPVDLALGSPYFAAVASGKGLVQVTSNDTCTGHYQLTGSGAGTAIANFESGST